ncbi:hypothetical protein CI610_02141 [invertebrate metagenome]|uniref:Uncharacterized protein n=1 Tax=invertebrate metagenome TaxID=1711999 RepID=A0A2H9T6T7_9ZZZZ
MIFRKNSAIKKGTGIEETKDSACGIGGRGDPLSSWVSLSYTYESCYLDAETEPFPYPMHNELSQLSQSGCGTVKSITGQQ